MEREEYEIREPGNENRLIKRILGWDADDAVRNARLYSKYRITLVMNRPTKPNIIEVAKN